VNKCSHQEIESYEAIVCFASACRSTEKLVFVRYKPGNWNRLGAVQLFGQGHVAREVEGDIFLVGKREYVKGDELMKRRVQ
jgi:hypothetical protein